MSDRSLTPDEHRFPAALRNAIGFVKVLELDEAAGRARVLFDGRAEFTHSGGTTVQGGILAAWIDHAMAWAVAAKNPKAAVASLEIKVSFVARVPPGPCICEARVLKWGRSVVFLEAELVSEAGKTLASASSSGILV
ncbi:MAG: PaaI family thioesterase [Burkholderiales bacterium]|nr:PaaI family thioesterase [Burkholderiales bacterium]